MMFPMYTVPPPSYCARVPQLNWHVQHVLAARISGVRGMHIAAQRNKPDDFALWRQHVGLKICEMQQMHDSLIRVYPTTSDLERFYYSTPMPYLIVDLPIRDSIGEASSASSLRKIRVSGSDIVYRYLLEASSCLRVSPEQYRQFDKSNPKSLPCLFYILQNVYMTSRSTDESTVHYLLEANDVSLQMRSIFIALCVVASMMELVTIIGIFRPALNQVYAEMISKLHNLSEIDERRLLAMHEGSTTHTTGSSAKPATAKTIAGSSAEGDLRGRKIAAVLDSDEESLTDDEWIPEDLATEDQSAVEDRARSDAESAEFKTFAYQSSQDKASAPAPRARASTYALPHHPFIPSKWHPVHTHVAYPQASFPRVFQASFPRAFYLSSTPFVCRSTRRLIACGRHC